ncbi:sterol uptake control protein 2 [Podospora australis]|uniref:Sterol uptake control protein 2 n=1 Tax=Podospora australis TaxID=1536484 RepID=A0AAN6WWN6_9PEZI|nr:sterol uptake control protein 2 [Podospora australis]
MTPLQLIPTHRATAFTNTFLVPNPNGSDRPTLRVVGPEEARKKRPHRCDEGEPCTNCLKRKETCLRQPSPPSSSSSLSLSNYQPDHSLPPKMDWRPTLNEPDFGGQINLLHMELLHHFEQFTIHTLAFKDVWPSMLQVAFQSRRHTYLVNGILSLAAAHLDYLVPNNPQYQRARVSLLNKALSGYREALSAPLTADNSDALLGAANLVHFLMWADLSFMDSQPQHQPLDLSGDKLYWLSTGVRQIYFTAWKFWQCPDSAFRRPGLLQPCMALDDYVDAKGLNWQKHVKGFMALYDNPRYHGNGRFLLLRSSPWSSRQSSPCPSTASSTRSAAVEGEFQSGRRPVSTDHHFKVVTLWQSYTEGVAYLQKAGAPDEGLTRAAYKRLVARLAVAMAYVAEQQHGQRAAGGSPFAARQKVKRGKGKHLKQSDLVRYVLTISMMCFGPLLAMISAGDSRALILLLHIYRAVGVLLPGDEHWWCRRRVTVMEDAIGKELKNRGIEFCLRRQCEVV